MKPDTQGFAANAEKGVLGSVTGIAKKAAAILGGAFVVQKGFDFLKDSVAAARESNAVAAQTAAVIKSTGGAANVTAKEIDALAGSIARKTGIDDEAIAKASNLLLTFTNVRNEAGKGNDVFNQATKTLADMGVALGTDASGAAIQLGKALNDPIAGISALTRVGVTFNDEQKKTIENLVKTGDVAGAQKIILAELGKEFGGSAEAQATASAKLKVALGNIQEEVGNKLIPILDKAATWLAEHLPEAIDTAGRAFNRAKEIVGPMVENVRGFIETLDRNSETIKKVAAVITAILIPHYVAVGVAAVASAAQQAIAWVAVQAQAIAATVVHSAQVAIQIASWIAAGVSAVANAAIIVASWVATAVAATANAIVIAAAWLIAMGPIALVVAAVVGLAIVFVKNFSTIKNAVLEGVRFIVDQFLGMASGIIHGAASAFGWVPGIGPKLKTAAREFDKFRDEVNAAINGIKDKTVTIRAVGKNFEDDKNESARQRSAGGVGAHAQGGVFSGWSWVGEEGPELIHSASLMRVHSNPESMAIMRAAAESMNALAGQATAAGQPLVGQMILQGATMVAAEANAIAVVRELKAQAWMQGK